MEILQQLCCEFHIAVRFISASLIYGSDLTAETLIAQYEDAIARGCIHGLLGGPPIIVVPPA